MRVQLSKQIDGPCRIIFAHAGRWLLLVCKMIALAAWQDESLGRIIDTAAVTQRYRTGMYSNSQDR